MEHIHVREARCLGDHRVRLRFSDGLEGEVDLLPALTGPIFEPLKDPVFFARMKHDGYTIEWPNGADFAPEFLHDVVTLVKRHERGERRGAKRSRIRVSASSRSRSVRRS